MGASETAVQIVMPQMGESVTEGTVLEWLKQVGDAVAADEPLLEISTDKVDTEMPAPASGVLTKIVVEPDETVAVGAVLGEIDPSGEAPAAAHGARATRPPAAEAPAAAEPAPAAPADGNGNATPVAARIGRRPRRRRRRRCRAPARAGA